ncbi:LIM domain protein [Ancylostoma caninum]|uniref:LIM domain protein n=1 Tax=Ancylostoma caninum TaxID=29170 RepID=A0A368FPZ3_ANCCA|nr:LIM domain protein [Ancylostoma caninum]
MNKKNCESRAIDEESGRNDVEKRSNINWISFIFSGVMCRAAGHDLHGDCLSCATCGSSLRNVGHHFIEDKFYCEVHGRQKKGLGPAMDPNLAA